MSAIIKSLDQWTFRPGVVPLEIHPVDSRAEEIHDTVAREDTERFKPLVRIAQDKVADELHRERGKLKPANGRHYQPRYFREAAS
jgi:hypothetical protein